jgi:hypothetical protein
MCELCARLNYTQNALYNLLYAQTLPTSLCKIDQETF